MSKYQQYKNSDISWIDQIPAHWEVKRLGTRFHSRTEANSDLEFLRAFKFNYGAIVPKNETGPQEEYADTYVKYTKVKKDDIMINGLNLNYDFVSQRVAIVTEPGIITSAYLTLRPYESTYSPYFCYLFKAMDSKKLFHGMGTGIRLTLSYDELKKQPIMIPPIEEQEQIVRYLDDKTIKIDECICLRERELQTLNELKQAEIAAVVTRGLNPDVPMKDSGIPWIGQIPAHWKICQLRKYLKLVSDKGHPEKQLLSITREQGVIVRDMDNTEDNHNFIPDDLSGYKLIKKGQFGINKMKAWQGSYGVSSYEGIVSPAYYVCDLNFANKDFFSLAIRSKAYIGFFTQYSKGIRVGQWDLNPIALKSIPFFEPPVEEQNAIVDYVNNKTQKIDSLIDSLNAEIERLKEYKQRLISDVVTGQINVQDETI